MSKVTVLASMLAVWVTCVASSSAGVLEAPAAPTDTNSAMYTVNDIYSRLTSGARTNPTAFAEPSGGPTNGTMHTLNQIYAIARPTQVQKTGIKANCYRGDDTWYSTNGVGVAWPVPRFTIGTGPVGTNVVTDNLTGLMWARDMNLATNLNLGDWSTVAGTCTWYQAFDVITNPAGPVNGASYGGYNDWRMPNIHEFNSLAYFGVSTAPGLSNTDGTDKWTEGNPFTHRRSEYWVSTTYLTDTNYALGVTFINEVKDNLYIKKSAAVTVWPVRGPVH